ncbi:hypothetical protein [Aquibacillus salsiterrae]|uniref:Uncharacterized protein n=1 Tax=Aquibacillus salsiterrae TaxID=2950439 RepID=A0A9X4AFV8_9BACI|nr:hypothetical protein [Aquibacillus salsiterrae]MDC3416635.1 hypothetical protein [Aquibacillus salsiterrae]
MVSPLFWYHHGGNNSIFVFLHNFILIEELFKEIINEKKRKQEIEWQKKLE